MSYKAEKRREQIENLVAEGFSVNDIAEKLKISVSTAQNDVLVCKKRFMDKIQGKEAEDTFLRIKANHDKLLREAWSFYYSVKGNANAKIGALKIVSDLMAREFDVYEKLGVIDTLTYKNNSFSFDMETQIQLTKVYEQVQAERIKGLADAEAGELTIESLVEDMDTSK